MAQRVVKTSPRWCISRKPKNTTTKKTARTYGRVATSACTSGSTFLDRHCIFDRRGGSQPLQRRNYPASAIVSLVPHIDYCIVGSPYQPLCRWNHMLTIVSLVPHAIHCIVESPYQPLYRWYSISTIVSLVPHINHCVRCVPRP